MKKQRKLRLDQLLVERELYETVEVAKRVVMAGLVFSEGVRIDKPGEQVDPNIKLEIKSRKDHRYVSRGGLKLEKALTDFKISVDNKVMIDIGSSTGGFTDCALQKGAKQCYAVDVGYNQLDWKLRQDERVIVMERTNFRHLSKDDLKSARPNFATIDVSFISLRLILPVLKEILLKPADVVALVKPQFEAQRNEVGAKGLVTSPEIHAKVLQEIINFAKETSFEIKNLSYSPITGTTGNIEFLLHLHLTEKELVSENKFNNLDEKIKSTVAAAHQELIVNQA